MSGSICVENQYFTFVCLSEEQQPRTVRLLTHFETRNHEIFIKIPCAAFKNYHQNLISFFVKLENVFFSGLQVLAFLLLLFSIRKVEAKYFRNGFVRQFHVCERKRKNILDGSGWRMCRCLFQSALVRCVHDNKFWWGSCVAIVYTM